MDLCTRKKKGEKKLEGWKSAFIAFSDKALVCETCSLCKVSLHTASIFRKKQSFGCHDVVTTFLWCRRKAELYKRATDLGFQQLSNQSAKNQSVSNILGAYSRVWKEPSRPPSTRQILLCASVLSVCVMYDFDRLSRAFHSDRPELVNRCCWSSWGWGHGVSPQTWSKRLPQPPVSPPKVIYVAVSHNFTAACKHRAEGKQLSLLEQPSRSTHHKKGQ